MRFQRFIVLIKWAIGSGFNLHQRSAVVIEFYNIYIFSLICTSTLVHYSRTPTKYETPKRYDVPIIFLLSPSIQGYADNFIQNYVIMFLRPFWVCDLNSNIIFGTSCTYLPKIQWVVINSYC